MSLIMLCTDNTALQKKLKKTVSIHCAGRKLPIRIRTYNSGNFQAILAEQYDAELLVFVDANMKYGNGIHIIDMLLGRNMPADVVLISAENCCRVGYYLDLLSCIQKQELSAAVPACIDLFLYKHRVNARGRRILIANQPEQIETGRLMYIESERHTALLRYCDDSETSHSCIADYENALESYGFVRTHRSFLVNTSYIESICNYKAHLLNGQDIPIARSQYKNVKDALELHQDICHNLEDYINSIAPSFISTKAK